MKKLLLFISIFSISLMLVGCSNKTEETRTTTIERTTIITTTKAPVITTTKSNEDRAKQMYRRLLSALCQYNGKTLEINGKVMTNDSSTLLMDYAFGINLGDNSTQTLYFTLASQIDNLAPSATAIINFKVVRPGEFDDYLYLNVNKDFVIFVKYLTEMVKEDFNKDEFYNRDDIKNATGMDVKVNLNELMSKEITITSDISLTVRTIVSQIFSTQTIGSNINGLLSSLKSYNILDKDYILNVSFLRDTLISVLYEVLYNEKTEDAVALKDSIIKNVDKVLSVMDYFHLKEVPTVSPYYIGFESDELNITESFPEIKEYTDLIGDDFITKLDFTANLNNDYFLNNLSFKLVKVERTELAERESALIEFKNIFSKELNIDITMSDSATLVNFEDLINIFK